ncbi:hypothetical protein TNCV_787221 [Trichonephila clavipes]|nr:hypothetical protein TNCV_787221 [Trichonephila clavipes]
MSSGSSLPQINLGVQGGIQGESRKLLLEFVISEEPFKAMKFVFACILVLALMSVACEVVSANNNQQNQNQNQQKQQQNQQKNNAGAQNAKNGQGNQNGP